MSDENTLVPVDSGELVRCSACDAVESGPMWPTLSDTQRAAILAFAYRAAFCFSGLLALAAFAADAYAQMHGLPFVVHDWMMDLILLPFGGVLWTHVKRAVQKR